MPDDPAINARLAAHREALNTYHEWDQKVKELLKGRRQKDLSEEDMEAYREAADQRDAAYNRMRELERALLEGIPGASTGSFSRKDLKIDDDK